MRTRRDEFTRRAILVEARAILSGQGLDALSLRSLAEAVGYSPAALYRYFANKDALLDAIRAEGWALLAGYETGRSVPTDPADRLRAYAGRILRFAAAHPEHYRLMMMPDAPPLPADTWRADPHTADLISFIDQAAERGVIRLGDRTPDQVALHLWLLAHGTAVLRQSVLRGSGWAALSDGVVEALVASVCQ